MKLSYPIRLVLILIIGLSLVSFWAAKYDDDDSSPDIFCDYDPISFYAKFFIEAPACKLTFYPDNNSILAEENTLDIERHEKSPPGLYS